MTEEEFEKMTCKFTCALNTDTKEPMEHHFKRQDFKPLDLEDPSVLFKLAAQQTLQNSEKINANNLEKYAVKYQVLSKHTNMIGVKKNKSKPQ